jgi:lysophospholipase L1-like esterase
MVGLTSVVLSAALVVVVARRMRGDERSIELKIDTRGFDPKAPSAIAADQSSLPSALEVATPRYPASTFRRTPWNPDDFPKPTTARNNPLRFDPVGGFTFSGGMNRRREWAEHSDGGWYVRTNSFGLRDDDEPSEERPDLRVVVVGDSHTAGYCNNAESFAQLAEARLAAERPSQRVEVLNAAVPGQTFVHHLGALERMLPFAPDVVVAAIYGGNDFGEALGFQHRTHGTARGDLAALDERLAEARDADPEAVSQFFFSVAQFHVDPAQIDVALQAARDVLTEIQITCLRHGATLVVLYLPPPPEIDWERRAARYERVFGALELGREHLRVLSGIGDATLAFLRARGVEVLDLRPAFRSASETVYWEQDFHLSVAGHALVAKELAPVLARVAPPDAARVRRGSPALEGEWARALLSPGAGKPAPEGASSSSPESSPESSPDTPPASQPAKTDGR